MTLCQTITLDFDNEMKATRKMLALVPFGAHTEFRPHERSMPLARLATHVAELPGWLQMALESEVFELSADFKPRHAADSAELLAMFDEAVAKSRAAIDAASDEAMTKTWSFKYAGHVVWTDTRPQVIRNFQNHLVHHRAQLGVYLRMLEIKIPGLYGPSADEPFQP